MKFLLQIYIWPIDRLLSDSRFPHADSRGSSGTLTRVGAYVLPQIGCLPLGDFLNERGHFLGYRAFPTGLTTFWPAAINPSDAISLRLLAFSISRLKSPDHLRPLSDTMDTHTSAVVPHHSRLRAGRREGGGVIWMRGESGVRVRAGRVGGLLVWIRG